MRFAGVLTVLFLFSTAGFGQTTIYVPDDYTTIQGAIDASSNGDTIIVRPNTYVENIDFIGKAITVKSEQGAEVTVIDGNRAGSVVTFKSGEGADSVLEGFTIKNGLNGNGGGINCKLSSPAISHNTIIENSASVGGGGIRCLGSSPAITFNSFSGNTSGKAGGAIHCSNSSPMIADNTISGNASVDGGGIACANGSSPTISGNTLMGNNASDEGGAIDCNYSAPIITDNIISGNNANDDGGGINCYYCSPRIIDNTIIKNTARDDGSGINCYYSNPGIINNRINKNTVGRDGGGVHCYRSDPGMINNTIIRNIAGDDGGGIYCSSSSPHIINNSISGNRADDDGGGIYSSQAKISNTIVWHNIAPAGTEIYGSPIVRYSNVRGGLSGAGNINADPLYFDASDDDFHLTWDSPCRNAGDSSYLPGFIFKDIEGNPRIAGGAVDMGADEYYFHLYQAGEVIPGSPISLRVVGGPGMPVLLGHSLSTQDPPQSTPNGDLYLTLPLFWSGNLGTIPSTGIVDLTFITIPSWNSGEEKYFQALVGAPGGPFSTLTNLTTLTVE